MLDTYTSPWMTEDLAIFKDAASKFMQAEFVPLADKWHEQGMIDRDAWNKAGEAGLLLTSIPEEYGGGGGDYRHEAILTEEQTRLGIGGWGQNVHSLICSHYFLAYGTEEQKKKYLPKMARGEMVCAIAMTEPGTGLRFAIGQNPRRSKTGNQYARQSARKPSSHTASIATSFWWSPKPIPQRRRQRASR